MNNLVFLTCLSVVLGIIFFLSFRHLPKENWQFLAALPLERNPDGTWKARNLTWYGALTAFAFTSALALFLILAKASRAETLPVAIFLAVVLVIAVPSAKIAAYIIEKRRGTMTIGGAVFMGLVASPWVLWSIEKALSVPRGELSPLLAAMVVAYALGEGLGRLACLSYGCCFGKRLDRSGSVMRFLFGGIAAVFRGKTKKAAYDGNLEGVELVPIQAITAVAYSVTSLISAHVFLCGRSGESFMIAAAATLCWRPHSEVFRADYRGGGRISAYQWMSAIGAVYSTLLFFVLPFPMTAGIDVLTGLAALADWRVLLLLEASFVGIFIFSGLSTVTDSRIVFSVKPEFLRTKNGHTESA